MTPEKKTPDAPSGPLYARESAEPPAVGTERGPGGLPGPQTGAESLDGLRARLDAAIRPVMLLGLQDAELFGEPGRERIGQWADWVLDTVTQVIDEPTVADAQAMLRRMAAAAGLMQCPTCGPTPTEPHPRRAGVDRCANCKTDATAVDGLRDLYAAAIREWHGDWTKDTFAEAADAVIAVRDEELQRLRAETATADQTRADVRQERDRLREELAASDETARRLLERHQELAAERYAWQERGLKAEATIARMKRTNRMVNGGARDARERAEKAEAANERVRALHDSLCRTDALTNPDDLITRGAAADRIATALDTSATPEDPS